MTIIRLLIGDSMWLALPHAAHQKMNHLREHENTDDTM